MDDESSASSDDDFMSPFAQLRATFPTPKCESETLTVSRADDASFIGARVSPVAFLEDDDEEDRNAIAPYRKALHESMESNFSNERTSLLGRRPVSRTKPSWDEESVSREAVDDSKQSHDSISISLAKWGKLMCIISGVHLACMALHDVYVWYLSVRKGSRQQNVAWRLPLLTPSTNTLIRFGALIPWNVLHGQSWRMLTSIFMSTSLVEYLLMCGAWYALGIGKTRHSQTSTWGLFLLSTLTGQLWTIAWDPYSVSGGALWGTCGILCGTRAANARQRFLLLVITTSLTVTALTDTLTNSIMGLMGSSAFGIAYYGLEHSSTVSPGSSIRMLSGVMIITLWVVPLLWIAFVSEQTT